VPTRAAWGTAGTDATPAFGAGGVVDVAGVALPGLAKVAGAGVEHVIDVKKASGGDGATITDLGRSLGKSTITLVRWSASQWDEFKRVSGMLQPLFHLQQTIEAQCLADELLQGVSVSVTRPSL